jgi:hypothetical protein
LCVRSAGYLKADGSEQQTEGAKFQLSLAPPEPRGPARNPENRITDRPKIQPNNRNRLASVGFSANC